MARTRTKNDLEYFKGRVRELEKENKHLKRSVSRNDKRNQQMENTSVEEVEEVEEIEKATQVVLPKCKDCYSTSFREVNLGIRILNICNKCGTRTKK